MIEEVITNKGVSLSTLCEKEKLMMVFVRHFGCTFCREALSDLEKYLEKINSLNTNVVIVHQMSDQYAGEILKIYNLDQLHRISDPELILYDFFRLTKGSVKQVMGPKVMWRALKATILNGHMPGKPAGDVWQMPGVFVLRQCKVVNKFVHEYASDKPDDLSLAEIEHESYAL